SLTRPASATGPRLMSGRLACSIELSIRSSINAVEQPAERHRETGEPERYRGEDDGDDRQGNREAARRRQVDVPQSERRRQRQREALERGHEEGDDSAVVGHGSKPTEIGSVPSLQPGALRAVQPARPGPAAY